MWSTSGQADLRGCAATDESFTSFRQRLISPLMSELAISPRSAFNEVAIMNKMQARVGLCPVVLAVASCDLPRLPELADGLELLAGDIGGGPGNVDGSGADAELGETRTDQATDRNRPGIRAGPTGAAVASDAGLAR